MGGAPRAVSNGVLHEVARRPHRRPERRLERSRRLRHDQHTHAVPHGNRQGDDEQGDALPDEAGPVGEVIGDRRRAAISGALFGLLIVLVCVRSWVPVRTYAHFDSDQAVFGLMAKDLVAGRGFPMFMYGQTYLLAVSVWLCAPLFAAFGASIATLKLPMFAMNIAVVAMLWRGLRADAGLGPWGTTLAILPFAMPSVVVSTRLVEHQGGNIEPFVFVLAAFFLRERPIALGAVAGVGFLNREFSLIGLLALLLMDAVQGRLRRRWKPIAMTTATFAGVVTGLRELASWSTSYAGTSALYGRPSPSNVLGFFGQQLPTLIGGAPRTLREFNIISSLTVGHGVVYVAMVVWICAVVATLWFLQPLAREEIDGMPAYLVLVGAGQAAAFWLLCYAPWDVMLVRYVLLCLLGLCGLVALAWRRPVLRAPTVAAIALMTAVNLTGNVRLIQEYAAAAPPRPLNQLADLLMQRGVRYAEAGYWTAYDVTFQTGERVIVSTPRGQGNRVARYLDELDAHRSEVYTLEEHSKHAGCEPILEWHLCPP